MNRQVNVIPLGPVGEHREMVLYMEKLRDNILFRVALRPVRPRKGIEKEDLFHFRSGEIDDFLAALEEMHGCLHSLDRFGIFPVIRKTGPHLGAPEE